MQIAKASKIVVAGGGTGGHITPALAVAEELKKQGCEVSFIGSFRGPERVLVEEAGLAFHGIQAGKLRRYFSWENLVDFFRVGIGFFQARSILARLKPDVVFAKGGFVSVPVVYAAAFLEIPIVSHESDVVMGLANRLAVEKSKAVCTGFPVNVYPTPLRPKLHYTGNPIRSIFYQKALSKKELLKELKLPNRPTILIMGGSQGALPINELILGNLAENLNHFNIIHLTGVNHLAVAQETHKQLTPVQQKHYICQGFAGNELVNYLDVADLVIARSSANVLTELAARRKAAVLIPLPSSASDHQRANAKVFKDKGAAVVYEEAQLNPVRLTAKINDLLNDEARLKELRRSIGLFDSPTAAQLISDIVIRSA